MNKRGILDLRLNLEIYLPFSKLIFRDFLVENFFLSTVYYTLYWPFGNFTFFIKSDKLQGSI